MREHLLEFLCAEYIVEKKEHKKYESQQKIQFKFVCIEVFSSLIKMINFFFGSTKPLNMAIQKVRVAIAQLAFF